MLVISIFVLTYACYFFIRIDVCLLFLLVVLMYACYFFIRIDVCLLFLYSY